MGGGEVGGRLGGQVAGVDVADTFRLDTWKPSCLILYHTPRYAACTSPCQRISYICLVLEYRTALRIVCTCFSACVGQIP